MTGVASACVVSVALCVASTDAIAQEPPPWTTEHGAFAFPNDNGTRLLTPASIVKPEALRTALCAGSRRIAVQFERRQEESANTTGRQTPRNFANTGGAVFRIVGPPVESELTCFLATETLASTETDVLAREPAGQRCDRRSYPQFQADKNRPVVACWPIAASKSGVRIALVEYARRLTQALACLVVIDGNRRLYVDYAAEFTGPGADLWRVDDGGEIHAEHFDVVFLLKTGSSYLLAIDWRGVEGNVLTLSVADDGEFRSLIRDNWYRAPM